VLSAVLRLLEQPRWTPPHLDPLAAAEGSPPPPTLSSLVVIFIVGLGSLLAGASLGPEATLVALAMGLGTWLGARASMGPLGQLLALASVGALLVAFLGALIAMAIPLLVLWQRARRLPVAAVATVLVAGVAAYGTLLLVQGDHHGYVQLPGADVRARDYVAALVLGAVAVGIGVQLRWFIDGLVSVTRRLDERTPWWLAATVFGAVLGLLYLIGGRSVEFSGSEGSAMLLDGEVRYGAGALLGLVFVKLLATGWSLSAGYRGGLVFPSLYAAVAISLAAATAFPSVAGPGVLIGSIAGLLVEMTAPALGVVMLLALLPIEMLPLGLAGAAGAVGGRALLTRWQGERPPADAEARPDASRAAVAAPGHKPTA
jgi:H+/Cl- antiporter ClcA